MLADKLRRTPIMTGVPRSGLVFEYLLNDYIQTSAVKDTGPTPLSGARVGTPLADIGYIGNGWNLNGACAINTNRKTPGGAVTYTFDLLVVSTGSTSQAAYFFADSTSGANASSMFAMGFYGTMFYVNVGNGSAYWSATPAHGLTVGSRYKVGVTFSGTTIKIFIDGELKHTLTSTISRAAAASPGDLFIGRFGQYAGAYLNSVVSHVRLYNRELSASEIRAISNEVAKKNSKWNPLDKGANSVTIRYDRIGYGAYGQSVRGQVSASSGRRMFEYTPTSGGLELIGVGTSAAPVANFPGVTADGWGYYAYSGAKYHNSGSGAPYGSAFVGGDVIGVVVDFGLGTLTYYKNGVSQGVAFTNMAGKTVFPMVGSGAGDARQVGGILNVGEAGFAFPIAGVETWV
ncbi:SPRY domain-containing protein [Aquipseudomonas campi]